MKVVVGSTNPVKIAAARAVFSLLDSAVEVVSLPAASGVSNQPWGDEEARRGALNRARAALSEGGDFGVGFEGGVIDTEHGLMACAWCAVVDRSGTVGLGGGVNVLLPPAVQQRLRAGGELGPAMDVLVGEDNTKQGPGAVGILTAELTNRQRAYEHILIMALAPFRRPDLYRDGDPPGDQQGAK
jgi:inosine/xanthosine triphosphatase